MQPSLFPLCPTPTTLGADVIYVWCPITAYLGHNNTLYFRFDKMTQQLLVIKKYAKHGPSGGGGERLSDVGGGAAAEGGGPSTPKVEPNSASTADVLATVSGESKASLFGANDAFLHGF